MESGDPVGNDFDDMAVQTVPTSSSSSCDSTFPEYLTFPSYISHQINTINTINKPGYRLVIPKWVANAKSPESSHSGSLANACCHVRRQRNRASTMDLFSCASVSVSDKAIHTQNKADNAL